MATEIPKCLFHGYATDPEVVIYTAPAAAGSYAIIREIQILCINDTAITLRKAGTGDDKLIFPEAYAMTAGDDIKDDRFLVLNAGETLRAAVTADNDATLCISGVEYTA